MKRILLSFIAAVILILTSVSCNASRTTGDGGVVSGDAGGARVEASDGIPNGNTAGDAGGVRTEAGDGLSGGVAGSTDGGDFRAASGGAGNAKAAVVDDFLGDVTAVSNGKDMPAFKGLALLRRDSLATGMKSWSSLELSEERFVLVEENSDVQISQLADDAKNAEITLSAGKIWVIITDKLSDDETFEIKTPTCSLSVRGTVFSVSCDEGGGSRVAVYEGTVRFTAEDENGDEVSVDITRGVAEVIIENGAVTEIKWGELNGGDLTPLQTSSPAGPGGVYDILRTHLPSLEPDMPVGFNIYEYNTNSAQFRYEGNWGNSKPNGNGTLYINYLPSHFAPYDPEIIHTEQHIITGDFFNGYVHGASLLTEKFNGVLGPGMGDTYTWNVMFDTGRAMRDGTDSGVGEYLFMSAWGVPPWCWETTP